MEKHELRYGNKDATCQKCAFLFICHKATFKQFNLQIKIFHSKQHFSSKLVIKKLFFENETHFSLNYFKNQTKIKNSLQNSFKLCKIKFFTASFSSVILHKATAIAFTAQHSLELVWPRNMNNISIES